MTIIKSENKKSTNEKNTIKIIESNNYIKHASELAVIDHLLFLKYIETGKTTTDTDSISIMEKEIEQLKKELESLGSDSVKNNEKIEITKQKINKSLKKYYTRDVILAQKETISRIMIGEEFKFKEPLKEFKELEINKNMYQKKICASYGELLYKIKSNEIISKYL